MKLKKKLKVTFQIHNLYCESIIIKLKKNIK